MSVTLTIRENGYLEKQRMEDKRKWNTIFLVSDAFKSKGMPYVSPDRSPELDPPTSPKSNPEQEESIWEEMKKTYTTESSPDRMLKAIEDSHPSANSDGLQVVVCRRQLEAHFSLQDLPQTLPPVLEEELSVDAIGDQD